MSDKRICLEAGSVLRLGGVDYIIIGVIGRGGNTVVYNVKYEDGLCEGYYHRAIIKELFPYEKNGGIYRGENGITALPGYEDTLAVAEESFLRGNRIHLDMLGLDAELPGGNINSYEEHGTLYSVLEYSGRETLSELMARGLFATLRDKAVIILKLLNALAFFHDNAYLHLDVSPENILISAAPDMKAEDRGLILIDYNSSWDKRVSTIPAFISIREFYTAPEVLLDTYSDISEATDIYSVGAVFAKLLGVDGIGLCSLRTDDIMPYIENENESVKHQVMRIISRCKPVLPKMRYKNVASMRADVEELIDRIDLRGLTHAALWECARRSSEKHTPPEYVAEFGEELPKISDDIWNHDVLISGEGGAGKSTILAMLLRDRTRKYNPHLSSPVFIPLRMCDGGRDFLSRYIVREITDKNGSAPSELVNSLLGMLSNGRLKLTLLLDGFDEVSCDSLAVATEINELRETGSVNVVITSRNNNIGRTTGFLHIRLNPLSEKSISEYLLQRGFNVPEMSHDVLSNPMMLHMYAESADNIGAESDLSEDSIIKSYLGSLVERVNKLQGARYGVSADYAISVLLPRIAGMGGAQIKFRTLSRIAEYDFKNIRQKSFAMAFPEFAGKSRIMAADIKNGSEWLDYMINELLCQSMRLLEKEENEYFFVHRKFFECFKAKYREVADRNRREVIKSKIPIVTAVFIASSLIIFGGVFVFRSCARKQTVFPDTEQEKNICGEAMDSIINTMIIMDTLLSNGTTAMSNISKAVAKENRQDYDLLVQRLTVMADSNEKIMITGREADRFIDTPIPCNTLKKLYSLPTEYKAVQSEKLRAFCQALEAPILSADEFNTAIESYTHYINAAAKLSCIYIKSIIEPVAAEAKKDVIDSFGVTNSLIDAYLSVSDLTEENFNAYEISLISEMEKYKNETEKYIRVK